MTIKEIYALPTNLSGWRILPNGNYVKLGKDVTLGDGVRLGDYVTLGDGVRLGDYVTLGDGVRLGNDVTLGKDVILGDGVRLGNDVTLGNYVRLGNYVTLYANVTLGNNVRLGDYVTLGDDVRLGDYVILGDDGVTEWSFSPLQIQGSHHLLYVAGPNIIAIGCKRYDARYWREHYNAIGRMEKYTKAQIEEYGKWLEIAIEWQRNQYADFNNQHKL